MVATNFSSVPRGPNSTRVFAPVLAAAGGVIVLLLVVAAIVGDHGVVRHEALRRQTAEVERLNERLVEDNLRLRAEAHALTSDPTYIELTIKDELGWVHEDDVVFKFEDPPPPID